VRGRLRYLAVLALLSAAVSLIYRFAPSGSPAFYASAFIGGMLFMAPFGTVMAGISELTPAGCRATMIAIGIMLMTIFGTAGGNAATGWLADHLTSARTHAPLTVSVLIVNLFAVAASALFYVAATRLPASPSDLPPR